ncbi:MAG: hypothetical protein M3157_01295 [Actinomycetota bacterium]|nr:hypothetical protein [Actinomycetota bacterium]
MFKLCVVLILVIEVLTLALLPFVAPGILVVLLAPLVPLTLVLAFPLHRRFGGISYRVWRLTPERITGSRPQEARETSEPLSLSRSIVERATEIRRAMLDSPSEVQVEICALGYRACVNDMITLTHLTNEELSNASLLRRIRLRRARRRATEALSDARATLPPGALRTTHQEKQ